MSIQSYSKAQSDISDRPTIQVLQLPVTAHFENPSRRLSLLRKLWKKPIIITMQAGKTHLSLEQPETSRIRPPRGALAFQKVWLTRPKGDRFQKALGHFPTEASCLETTKLEVYAQVSNTE